MGKKINVQGSVASENIWGEKSWDKVLENGDVNLIEIVNWLSEEQKDKMLKLLIKDKEKTWGLKEKLFGHRQSILAHLKQNCVEIKDAEMMWIKWKIIRIELPGVWHKFECFVWDEYLSTYDDDVNEMIDKMGFEVMEIVDFLSEFDKYMNKNWVNLDKKSRIKEIKNWPVDESECVSLPAPIINALSAITWQKDQRYLLKDRHPKYGNRIELNCDSNSLEGYWFCISNGGRALFKLPKSS